MKENKILGLRTCIYRVEELDKAKEWYARAFGVAPYFDEPYYVGFNIGGYELGLQTPENGQEGIKAVNIATYWGVEDIATAFQHFIETGATAFEEPMNVGGELMVATLKDPWGNLIGLIYNPAFKAD